MDLSLVTHPDDSNYPTHHFPELLEAALSIRSMDAAIEPIRNVVRVMNAAQVPNGLRGIRRAVDLATKQPGLAEFQCTAKAVAAHIEASDIMRIQRAIAENAALMRTMALIASLLPGPRILEEFVEDRLGLVHQFDVEVSEDGVGMVAVDARVIDGGWNWPEAPEWLKVRDKKDVAALIVLVELVLFIGFGLTREEIRAWVENTAKEIPARIADRIPWTLQQAKRDAPIRDGISRHASEVGRVSRGEIVSILDGGERWCEVRTLRLEEGWIFRGHLRQPE